MSFSPFNKPFEELTIDDLDSLKQNHVSEGWFIEYKSDFARNANRRIDGAKLVRTIAAFSNTRGGWMIIGVKTKGNLPDSFDGIDVSSEGNLEDTVSRIIAANTSPVPFFHLKSINVAEGKV